MSNRIPREWTYVEAQRTVPYVRCLLRSLREHFLAVWHFYRLNGYDASGPQYRREIEHHRREGESALNDLLALGLVPYQSPARGIALFAFTLEIEANDGSTGRRDACFIYKDSHNRIDTWAFMEDLFDQEVLVVEMPVPEQWKAAATGQLLIGVERTLR